jgi:molybdopterin-guanine dinucleotide biosynthesis protein
LEDYKIISVVGNVKNAGKTTVMNSYLTQLENDVAITSIGLDGEEIDQVTSLEKPQILVKPGYIVASAKDTLDNFTCDYEVIKETNINTSIGKVVIVRVNSYGKALVAGPAKVKDMEKLIDELEDYQLSKIIIDGAFSRHVFAKITQATILVIGANYSRDINVVINDAQLTYKKFTLKSISDKRFSFGDKISCIDYQDNQFNLEYSSIIGNVETLFSLPIENLKLVYFPKSITNKFVEKLIIERKKCKFDIVIDSPINIQLNNHNLEKLFKLKNQIYVLNPINLALVCYNPHSPQGYEFDNREFEKMLQEAIGIEVIDVLKDGIAL